MASDLKFVEFVVDQVDADCAVTYKRMFGEFGLYSGGTFFAVICDDQLFVKPTTGGREYIGSVVEAPPYPGAKPSLLIQEQIEDGAWLSELVRITVRELPAPKAKKPRAKKRARTTATKKEATTKVAEKKAAKKKAAEKKGAKEKKA